MPRAASWRFPMAVMCRGIGIKVWCGPDRGCMRQTQDLQEKQQSGPEFIETFIALVEVLLARLLELPGLPQHLHLSPLGWRTA